MRTPVRDRLLYLVILATSFIVASHAQALPANEPIILFNGKDLSWFVGPDGQPSKWRVQDGTVVSTPNGRRSNLCVSRLLFRNARIELEFWQPSGSDGNSGVFVHGYYEIQILASDANIQPIHGLGAIYGIHAPLKATGRPLGEWQSLKIEFKAPRWKNESTLAQPGEASVWLNGELIHDKAPLGETGSEYNPYVYDTNEFLHQLRAGQKQTGVGPLMLQDHDCAVRFRKIVVTPLDDAAIRRAP